MKNISLDFFNNTPKKSLDFFVPPPKSLWNNLFVRHLGKEFGYGF